MAYFDDNDDDEIIYRNRRNDSPWARRVLMPSRPVGYPPVAMQQPRSPMVDPNTGRMRTGLVADAAAQALAAMSPLPAAPPATGDQATDMRNLIEYQRALAETVKRDEQLRTLGALAKLFLT